MGSSDQLRTYASGECQLLLVPRLSFVRFSRLSKGCMLDSNLDAPGLPAIRRFRGTVCLFGGREIDEKIAMIPSTWVTKSGCPWDDDLTYRLPS